MKQLLSMIGCVIIALALGFIIGRWPLWHYDSCLQQQAGYQVALTSQTKLLTTQIDLLVKEKARAGVLQAAHTALQQELAVRLAQSVVIPEPKAMLVSQLEPIEQLAARMAPVEAAVKEVAKQEGGFIPGAVRGQWAEVVLRAFGRGK